MLPLSPDGWGKRQFSTLQEFAGARAVNGSGINGQDDGTPQCNLVQQVGSAGTVPQAERGQPIRDGRQVFRRMRPCQGQQAGDGFFHRVFSFRVCIYLPVYISIGV